MVLFQPELRDLKTMEIDGVNSSPVAEDWCPGSSKHQEGNESSCPLIFFHSGPQWIE